MKHRRSITNVHELLLMALQAKTAEEKQHYIVDACHELGFLPEALWHEPGRSPIPAPQIMGSWIESIERIDLEEQQEIIAQISPSARCVLKVIGLGWEEQPLYEEKWLSLAEVEALRDSDRRFTREHIRWCVEESHSDAFTRVSDWRLSMEIKGKKIIFDWEDAADMERRWKAFHKPKRTRKARK